MRIVVLGYVVRAALGGMVWSNLQYLMGLAELGHDVFFVEDSDAYASCYDPVADTVGSDPSYGLRFAHDSFSAIGFGERWAYHDAHRSRWCGPCADRAHTLCSSAELLLNLCGVNPMRPWFGEIPCKVLVDEDPAFTQIRHLTKQGAAEYAKQHDAFFTFAHNIGRSDCLVPDDGITWKATRQPVVLAALPPAPPAPAGRFTTVMNWQSYEPLEYRGVRYGLKSESMMPFMSLPRLTQAPLEIALGGANAPRRALAEHGWLLRDSREPTASVASYLDYIRRSKAELSVAKHAYVASRSGWFSERSLAYMVAGRPVAVQDTGFSAWLPQGEGVFAFSTIEEAAAAVECICTRYEAHCRAARAIAEEYFDARRVLAALIDQALTCGPQQATEDAARATKAGAL